MKGTSDNVTINMISEAKRQFLPDIVTEDPVSVILPTIDELIPFGKANLRVIRRSYRQQEREINRLLSEEYLACNTIQSVTTDDLRRYISLYETETYSEQQLEEWRNGSDHTRMCEWRSRGERALSCTFGKCVAAYCPMNPGACRGCEDLNSATNKAAFGLDIWRKDFPFADKPCILMAEEAINQCKQALLGHIGKLKQRLDCVRTYVMRLTKAIKSAEERPIFAIFRDIDGWVDLGDTVALLMPTIGWDDPALRFIEKQVIQTHASKWIFGFFYMENLVSITSDGTEEIHRIWEPNLLRGDEVEYLKMHKDYLDLWLDWSLLRARKDEIAPVKAAIRRALV